MLGCHFESPVAVINKLTQAFGFERRIKALFDPMSILPTLPEPIGTAGKRLIP
jgi:hypothetical protein